MVEGCGLKTLKFLLCVINGLFIALALAALGGTAYVLSTSSGEIGELLKVGDVGVNPEGITNAVRSAAIVVIVSSVIIIIVGTLGFIGALKEVKWCLVIYLICLGLVLVFEIAAVALAVVFYNQVSAGLMRYWQYRIDKEYDGLVSSSNPFTIAMNLVQVQFECCGVNSYLDFQNATRWNRTLPGGRRLMVPVTCCILSNPNDFRNNPASARPRNINCPVAPTTVNSYFQVGCYSAIKDFAFRNARSVIGFAAAVIAFEIFCFVAAICLCQNINKYSYA